MRLIILLIALTTIALSKNCSNTCDCATYDCKNRECVNGTCNEVNCTQCKQLYYFVCWNGTARCERGPTWG